MSTSASRSASVTRSPGFFSWISPAARARKRGLITSAATSCRRASTASVSTGSNVVVDGRRARTAPRAGRLPSTQAALSAQAASPAPPAPPAWCPRPSGLGPQVGGQVEPPLEERRSRGRRTRRPRCGARAAPHAGRAAGRSGPACRARRRGHGGGPAWRRRCRSTPGRPARPLGCARRTPPRARRVDVTGARGCCRRRRPPPARCRRGSWVPSASRSKRSRSATWPIQVSTARLSCAATMSERRRDSTRAATWTRPMTRLCGEIMRMARALERSSSFVSPRAVADELAEHRLAREGVTLAEVEGGPHPPLRLADRLGADRPAVADDRGGHPPVLGGQTPSRACWCPAGPRARMRLAAPRCTR